MQVEAKKTYRTGFVLKESELRRIVDTIQEQFGKLSEFPKSQGSFRVKLRNGVYIETSSLDEVLAIENGGSSQIVRLMYTHQPEPQDDSTVVRVEFINADLDEETGYTSIRFLVHGSNRDWVFVTSSQLEERCEKIRRFAMNQLGGKGPAAMLFRLSFPFITLLILFIILGSGLGSIAKRPPTGKLLDEAIKAGTIKEPLQALVFIEKQRDELKVDDLFPTKFAVIIISIFVVIILAVIFLMRLYPVYNFCWGEYADEFQRKESRRQFWLVIIVIGTLVSFVGGLLANNMGAFKNWFAQ